MPSAVGPSTVRPSPAVGPPAARSSCPTQCPLKLGSSDSQESLQEYPVCGDYHPQAFSILRLQVTHTSLHSVPERSPEGVPVGLRQAPPSWAVYTASIIWQIFIQLQPGNVPVDRHPIGQQIPARATWKVPEAFWESGWLLVGRDYGHGTALV